LRLLNWRFPHLASKTCTGSIVCSNSSRKHVLLGKYRDKQYANAASQEYHSGFAIMLAADLSKAIRRQQACAIWQYIRPNG
jgi:hypothetical protein